MHSRVGNTKFSCFRIDLYFRYNTFFYYIDDNERSWILFCLYTVLIYLHLSILLYEQVLIGDNELTHWGRVTYICVGKLTIIGSDNGLSPGWRQAIIWTNAGILLIEPLGTNFSEILIGIQTFSFTKMRLKMSSAKWRLFCLGLNVLKEHSGIIRYASPA